MNVISLIDKFPLGTSAQKGYFLYTKLPSGLFAKMEADNFKGTIRYVGEHSQFYRRKFREHGIDPLKVTCPRDLGDLFTTPEDIRANPDEFLCAAPDTAYESTGTTSKKTKRVYFSRQEVKDAGWAGAVGLWGLGVRPEDRVVSAFDYSFWVSGPVLQASCEVLGCFHVEAGRLTPEDFYERLSDYRVTVIVGDPSWLLRLSEIAEKKGPWPIKLMIGGGENLTEDARAYIQKVWRADFILSYGQTEAFGAIGMESRDRHGYHLNEFHNYFEILSPDADGYGELVYTTLNRRVMPLVRYRSGDITRFMTGRSASGLPGRRIEKLKGRIDEWIPTALGNIAPWMFEEVFKSLEGTADWQIAVQKERNKDRIEFRVESGDGPEIAGMEQKVMDAFRTRMPEQWKLSEMDLCSFGVKIFPKGGLRSGRKLKRIIDERRF